jgi:hypothetical protein
MRQLLDRIAEALIARNIEQIVDDLFQGLLVNVPAQRLRDLVHSRIGCSHDAHPKLVLKTATARKRDEAAITAAPPSRYPAWLHPTQERTPMTEEAIKFEMRLSAIEYLLCKAYLVLMLSQGQLNPANFDQFAKDFVAGAAEQKFPVGDPALSDHVSAEWETAIERLINMQKDLLAQVLPKGSGTRA